jgi:Sec-independent protein translocase protein TatA
MDSIFGIGLPELIFILLLAGIVMGPQRIRQVARWLGRATAQLQAISHEFARQLNAELDSIDGDGDIKGAMQDVQELRRQVADLKRELLSVSTGLTEESRSAWRDDKELLQRRIQPPTASDLMPRSQAPAGGANGTADTTPPTLPKPVVVPDDPES